MPNILVADDHQMVREGLKRILAESLPEAGFGEAGTVPETLTLLKTKKWNLLLLDIFMPGGGGFEVLQKTVVEYPKLPVLVISSAPPEQLALRMLRSGAAGYLNKQAAADELVQAVKQILGGNRYLSPKMAEQLLNDYIAPPQGGSKPLTDREFQVFQLIVGGKSLKEIAYELGLSPKTISTFQGRILRKLRLRNTVELIRYALEHHLVEGVDHSQEPDTGKAKRKR